MQRDSSINGRIPNGAKVGSRKHQRWMNKNFLYQQNTELSLKHELDFVLFDNSSSPFSELFEEQNREKLAAFVHGTNSFLPDHADTQCFDPTSAQQSFFKLERNLRRLLRTLISSEFLKRVDNDVRDLLRSDSDVKTYLLDNSMERIVVHAVCSYYHLKSQSQDAEQGRLVIVRRTTNFFPQMTLLQYLQSINVQSN